MIIKYKLSDFAKDMAVQNKQVVDLLNGKFGEVKKHTTPLSEAELDFLFEHFTRGAEVASFEEYLASAPAPAAKKPEPKPAPAAPAKQPSRGDGRPVAAPAGTAAPASANQPAKPKAPAAPPPKKRDGLGRVRIRDDKPEKEVVAPKREVVTRTIDTSGAYVNLDKFNDKYNELASTKNVPTQNRRKPAPSRQKPPRGRGKGAPFTKKQETEAERLQRIQLEKARKAQLKVSIPDEITVGDLAARLKVTAPQVIKKLMGLGVMASVSEVVDFDTAATVAEEFHAKVEREVRVTIEERLFEVDEDDPKDMVARPPVVVVMGHVDHGKTSILDAIRTTHVASGEAGGITQHIGAYQIEKDGKKITFLDTPGHEAFTSMRARGANLTDIAVLVVAADDGIMPQTVESINHAKAAGVTIIVAVNKIDKETANVEKVKQQLTEYEIVPEEWGGDTVVVPVSAHTGQGIDDLLEMINLTADVKELKANPNRRAKGAVIEARLDKGQGPVATILVQKGTLNKGDVVIAGTTVGRVRTMRDAAGTQLETAGPSTPVEITGLTDVPAAGDLFDAVEDERLARELADQRSDAAREEQLGSYTKVTLDNLFSQIEAGEKKELAIIVKADVQGSAEAIKQSLEKLSNDEVRVKVIHTGVGAINKSDVMLAGASGAIVIGFNVRPDPVAKADAAQDEVELRMYRVIYDAIDDVENAMKGMLAPKIREVEQGRIEVRQVFKASNIGTIAGCYVLDGFVTRGSKIRIVRDGIVITEDEIKSLRRFKDDVKEVASGYECGIGLEKFNDIKEGDIYESFILEEYRD
ncbi:translation initiation factor IF-2 [Ruminococcaceae bacterium OttesenSCG-928-D13]|nr:translation initiation factor IF-2 [Ruminococcaceae bacterium OttesenSCG-928-D13]